MTARLDYREVAAKAADEIERRGWTRGTLGSNKSDPENCKVCALGAINAVVYSNPFGRLGGWGGHIDGYSTFIDFPELAPIAESFGANRDSSVFVQYVHLYNDIRAESAQDVIDKLRQAANSVPAS